MAKYCNGFDQILTKLREISKSFSNMEETIQITQKLQQYHWHVSNWPAVNSQDNTQVHFYRADCKPPDFSSKQHSERAGTEALGCISVKPKSTVHSYRLVCILWTVTGKTLHILFKSTFFLTNKLPLSSIRGFDRFCWIASKQRVKIQTS